MLGQGRHYVENLINLDHWIVMLEESLVYKLKFLLHSILCLCHSIPCHLSFLSLPVLFSSLPYLLSPPFLSLVYPSTHLIAFQPSTIIQTPDWTGSLCCGCCALVRGISSDDCPAVSPFSPLLLVCQTLTCLSQLLLSLVGYDVLQGQPVLVAVDHDNCEHRFDWPTAVVCKNSLVKPDTGCKFTDKEANISFTLSVLTPNGNDIQVHCNISVLFNLTNLSLHYYLVIYLIT